METKTKLNQALKNIPQINSYNWDKESSDFIKSKVTPLIHIRDNPKDYYNELAIITHEDGSINDWAFDYHNHEISDVTIELKNWADKYGFFWECLSSGTFGLYES
tara:strand:- start:67 stop:381 length:315 start_codon:yes stop_codon:yes gene_type:complete